MRYNLIDWTKSKTLIASNARKYMVKQKLSFIDRESPFGKFTVSLKYVCACLHIYSSIILQAYYFKLTK